MKVFSSYYDNVPNLEKNTYTFVRVSRKEPPEWLTSYVDLSGSFGPTEAMLKECHPTQNWKEFEPRYKNEILGALDKELSLNELLKIYNDNGCKPLLLLCWESSKENCHRDLQRNSGSFDPFKQLIYNSYTTPPQIEDIRLL